MLLEGFMVTVTNPTLPSTGVVWDRLGRVGTVDSGIGFEKLFAQLSTTDLRPFLTSLQLFLQMRAQQTCRERFLDKTKYFPERIFLKGSYCTSVLLEGK